MKNFLLLFALMYIPFSIQAQSAKEMQNEIAGKWTVDDNGNVTISKIVEVPNVSKNDIYIRTLNYFTYNYNSGKDVIQTQDKETGLIVGKGVYKNTHSGSYMVMLSSGIDTWHIIRVDIKEGRARITLTLTEYQQTVSGGKSGPDYYNLKISQQYPVNPEGSNKKFMMKAFYRSFLLANNSIDKVEKAIQSGSISDKIENTDW